MKLRLAEPPTVEGPRRPRAPRRASIAIAVVLGLAAFPILAAMPSASAQSATPPVDCGPSEGRERFTTEGFSLDFDAPAVFAPVGDYPPEGQLTAHAARFPFVADFAPYKSANVAVTLEWGGAADFDIWIVYPDGSWIGSTEYLTNREQFVAPLTHCDQFRITVLNFYGHPAERLHLDVDVDPGRQLLACRADDSAPNCAGKSEGEPPAPPLPDNRAILYLGGPPGTASMAPGSIGHEALPTGTLNRQRPTTGLPNIYSRLVAGSRRHRDALDPHFTATFPEARDIHGTAHALLWLSSSTMDQSASLHVDLYADGERVSSATLPGTTLNKEHPMAMMVAFEELDLARVDEVTLQLATTPSDPGSTASTAFNIAYGSVQFQSRLTLP
jgi:hypothetical protein